MDTTAPRCYRHQNNETYITCQRCEKPICPNCMVPSAVGHQCPDCVREGVKSTRQMDLPYGGTRAGAPMVLTYTIMGICGVVWVAALLLANRAPSLVEMLGLLPETSRSVDSAGFDYLIFGVNDGQWWRLFTSMFTHEAIWHLAMNMYVLFIMGTNLEPLFGRLRYALLVLVSGFAGSVAVLWLSAGNGITIGFSGAVYGMLAAYLLAARRVNADTTQILFWIGLNLVLTFTFPGISWQGHLGGLVGGLVVAALVIYTKRGPQRSLIQLTGIGLFAAFLVALSALWVLTH